MLDHPVRDSGRGRVRARDVAALGSRGYGSLFDVFWPVACFGAFFVTPLLLCRFSRIGDSILVLADSTVVALLAYLFAVEPYIPKM